MAHREYYNKQGQIVPSVTTIVKLLEKENLSNWHNWMGLVRHINTANYLEQKAQYGQYCHTLFETYFMGLLSYSMKDPRFVTDDEFRLILKKFNWLKQKFETLGIRVINMEMGMDGKRFGGTLDMLAMHHNNNRVFLIDLKTSKKVYSSHFLQLAGYTMLLEEVFGISVTDVGIFCLSQSEEQMLQLVKRENNRHNEEIFLKLLDIYYLQRKE